MARIDLQFNHFLVRDEEPLLFHTGMRRMFPEVREAVARASWIRQAFAGSVGVTSRWTNAAPSTSGSRLRRAHRPPAARSGAMVNVQDFASRPPRGRARNEVIETGNHRFRFIPTPHLPHGWDAGVLFEESSRLLLCSDLFHQVGDREPVTTDDVVQRWGHAMAVDQAHPVLMDYMPYTPATRARLED